MEEKNILLHENIKMKDGILLVDKSPDWTSNDVVMKSRHLLHTKKIGHTGTLDPFATGLLILTVNEGTKAGRFIEDLKKTYIATLKLGVLTDSGDLKGKVLKEEEIKKINKEDILKVFQSLLGKQKQIPPMYSAIKINGEKLYELARKGLEVERKARDIEIYQLNLISFDDDTITFEAEVSKGTYIRTLGETIANKLNNVGHLVSLRRTKVGKYDVKDACKINDISLDQIIPLSKALNFMKNVSLDDRIDVLEKVRHGNKVHLDIKDELVSFYLKDKLLAIYQLREDGFYYSLRGFNHAD